MPDDSKISNFILQNQDLLSPIGITPGKKGEEITHLYYENLKGITAQVTNNPKLAKVMEIIDEMEVDLFAFNEHKINFLHRDNRHNGLGLLFIGGETITGAIDGNVKHPITKRLGCHVERGMGMVAYGELASLM